ncbi:uncharacterized protein LOC120287105 [Eucalyptus grandis]|uniref:uncharacterized protein LOC120287105 n=1 Tax=Eucalyptus grandis TaxID=71139 RepID=UPI00192EEF9D|nr:uncharacterized protein LOC120287105 [Eucalyptus grandis]
MSSFLCPSPYDTAWLAMIPDPRRYDCPMFKGCLNWVLHNQNEEGFWGDYDYEEQEMFSGGECLASTLICMIVLKKWHVGSPLIERGLKFIHENAELLLLRNGHGKFPRWIAIILPGIVDLARAVGLEIIFPESTKSAIANLFSNRQQILESCSRPYCSPGVAVAGSGHFSRPLRLFFEVDLHPYPIYTSSERFLSGFCLLASSVRMASSSSTPAGILGKAPQEAPKDDSPPPPAHPPLLGTPPLLVVPDVPPAAEDKGVVVGSSPVVPSRPAPPQRETGHDLPLPDVGKRLPFHLTEDALKHAWGNHLVQVIAADLGFYYFHIPDKDFRRKVLEGVPITVAKIPLILQQWHPMMELKKDCHKTVPVWVRLRNLPVNLWFASSISALASVIGKPLFVDNRTEQMAMVAFARICIEINAASSFPEVIDFMLNGEPRSVDVHYEWVPTLCPTCCSFGHKCANPKAPGPPIASSLANKAPSSEWRQVGGKRNRPRPLDVAPPTSRSTEPPPCRIEVHLPAPQIMKPAVIPPAPIRSILESSSSSDNEVVDDISSGGSDPDSPLGVASSILEELGLGSPLKQAEIRNFVRTNHLSCVGILETKISPAAFPLVSGALIPGWCWSANNDHSPRGRIWVGWNPKSASFALSACSSQAIHGRLIYLNSGISFIITVVYAEHSFTLRRPLWADLIQSSFQVVDSPWIVAGDFNAIRSSSDKADISNYWIPAFNDFGDCLNQAGLDDLRYVGNRFTWSASSGPSRKLRKIDKVLTNSAWNSIFSFSEASFLPPGVSDHSPMMVRILPTPNTPRALKYRLKLLNKEVYADISAKTDEARRLLSLAQEAIQLDPHNHDLANEEKEHFRVFSELRLQEESFFRQKSRIRWLKEGDLNTKYFHHLVKRSHLRNRILSIYNGDTLVSDPAEVHQLFVSHFQALLAASPPSYVPTIEEIRKNLNHTLDDNQIRTLSQPVTDKEIQDTLFSLASGKAPGPDGFNVDFFKRSWEIIGPSVLLAVRDFFASGHLLKEINSTILTLVPKVPNASSVNDFRPIACCNTIYKCITKIMANRLAVVLPSIISLPQNAFVKGRRISDNIILAQELFVDFHHEPYRPKCIIKVDFCKAFDSIDWNFIELTLLAFGFPPDFVHRMMTCIRSPKYSISLNGELHGFFSSGRGIRQGDPMSPYLFTLVMEVFSGILNTQSGNLGFDFFWRCKATRLSHLFFADDVLLFSEANMSSLRLLLDGIHSFARWSGLNPNLNKSEIFLSGDPESLRNALVYWSSVFILPASVSNRIEQIFRQFLWRGPSLGAGGAKVAWVDVCLPKEEGGLGIRSLRISNIAIMLKHLWLLFTDKESLWSKWIHSIFLKHKNFWIVPRPTYCSWAWKKLLGLRDLIQHHFKWRVGNGLSVSFWFDHWHPRGPLYKLFSDREIYCSGISRLATVATAFSALPPSSSVASSISNWNDPLPTLNEDSDRLLWLGHPSECFLLPRLGAF